MKLAVPFSAIASMVTSETFGLWGLAALVVCVIAWLIREHIHTQARIYEKQIDAYPKLMKKDLRRRRRRRR